MKNSFTLAATIMIALTLSLGGMNDAEAKRLGGGMSFGGKSRYSSPYKRSATQPTRSASQQQAYQKNQAARQTMSKRGGLMGMLGALALGGLLGSLFFGGAFEGFNFMDILIFGGIAYLLYRLFAAKARQSHQPASAYQRNDYSNYQEPENYQDSPNQSAKNPANFDTDILFGKDKNKTTSNFTADLQNDADFHSDSVPAGFDEQDFLAGAESAFRQLQKAWDSRDLADIRGLTTDKVFAEIQQQLSESDENNQTDILKLHAELLEIREIGNELEAVVLFDSIIRENPQEQAQQVREVWHFVKPKNSLQPTWFLDGIQQLEE
jgi:predicted lipid-binding transport protein (Tim44 family)